jgi:hypothetical protein
MVLILPNISDLTKINDEKVLNAFKGLSEVRKTELRKKKLSELYATRKDLKAQIDGTGEYENKIFSNLEKEQNKIKLEEVEEVIEEKQNASGVEGISANKSSTGGSGGSTKSTNSDNYGFTTNESSGETGTAGAATDEGEEPISESFGTDTGTPLVKSVVKISAPFNGQKVTSPITFKFRAKGVAKVQFFADIPGNQFGAFGPILNPSEDKELTFTFNVTGKRKVKIQALDSKDKPIAGDNLFDIIDIEVVTEEGDTTGGAISNLGQDIGSGQGQAGLGDTDPDEQGGTASTGLAGAESTLGLEEGGGAESTEVNPEEVALAFQEVLSLFSLGFANLPQSNIVLTDIENYDLSDLRLVPTKSYPSKFGQVPLFQDPVAFMTNQVWDYFAFNKDAIAFSYTNDILKKYASDSFSVNVWKGAIDYFKKFQKPNLNQQLSAGEINKNQYNKSVDFYMRNSIQFTLRSIIEEEYPNVDVNEIIGQGPILFWGWIRHIFINYIEMEEGNPDPNFLNPNLKGFRVVVDSKNLVTLSIALYYLERELLLSGPVGSNPEDINIYDFLTKNVQQKLSKSDYTISTKIFNYVEKGNTFYNKNNYLLKKEKPTLSLNSIVQIDNSAFFAQNEATLSPSETKQISNQKQVKQCKNVSASKKETGLRLFYKEGNDNILDKPVPATNLGCDTPTKEWTQADNILFDAASLVPRLNFTLPYMTDITIVGKELVPKELDIHTIVANNPTFGNIQKTTANFKSLATKLIQQNFINKEEELYLVDGQILLNAAKTSLSSDKLLNSYNNKNLKGWGATIAIDQNEKYKYDPKTNPRVAEQYSPYIGAFNFGYQVIKTSKENEDDKQYYYVNTLADQTTKLTAFDSVAPYNYNDQNLKIYDSQIKYGRGYQYDLSTYVSLSEIKYNYKSFKTEFYPAVTKKSIQKKIDDKLLELQNLATDAEDKGILVTSTPEAKAIFEEIAKLQATKDVATNVIKNVYYFEYELGPSQYVNTIKELDLASATSEVSYIELPPTPLFMRVYPLRGVNDKILLNFDNYSFKKSVVKEKIPKKYWPTDGSWEQTRQFFVNSFNALSKDQLDSLGVTQDPPADDEMYFTRTNIDRIQLYYAEGKKPKDFLDMEKYLEPINISQEGFTKELNLKPNTKYYFSAKAISFLDLESDYSQVYEVELVDEDGAVFTIVNIVDLKDQSMKRPSKLNLNKKFRIEPAILQQAPNPAKNNIGYLTPSVFSPTNETKTQFKIRLTSKKTGRKVDFNLIYKQNLVEGVNATAGNLSLGTATKDNVLISYFSEDASETPVGPTVEETLQQQIQAEEAAVQFDSSKQSTCCTFNDKVLLFKDVSPTVQSTWLSTSPPQLADGNFNAINAKLALIDNSINFLQAGSQTIGQEAPIAIESIVDQIKGDSSPGNIIKGMSDSQKCYLCKRVAEYADGTSMLGAIEIQIGLTGVDRGLFLSSVIEKLDNQQVPEVDQNNNPDPYNYLKVLESLNCKQFGFASIYGGDFGVAEGTPLEGEAAVKCSTFVEKKTLS